ncbi:YIP1 family protein [Streptomyces sp. URMC 123]|uniref:Yip1 family protein n=1 Tax=Streptomyces sp. URMC 123 TaxID=3423403 RepID=UPI003F1BC694
MAGFRMGRGRDSRSAQQQASQQGQQPYGAPYGGRPVPPPHGQQGQYGQPGPRAPYGQQAPQGRHPDQWQQPYGGGPGDEPEYFGDGGHGADPYANSPGHTQAFRIDEGQDPYGAPYDPYDGGDDRVSTYRAGQDPVVPAGPRLPWKELLSGIVLRPGPTFWQMRDYPVWGPALVVTFVYGLLAVFGFDKARQDVLNATLSNSIPWVVISGIAMIISGLLLGAVTHTLARQLGGNGTWQPTVGLSMLIMAITDAPRLLFAMFLGGDSPLVQVLGWATWVAAGALFTSMVSKSHDLAWPKALGASSIQLVALLALVKLGTL